MSEINDFLDGKQSSEIDGFLGPDTPKPSGAIRRIADQGIKLAQGVVGVPEAAVGVADLVTGGRAGKLAESAGVRFKDAKDIMGEYLSPEQKAADAEVQKAEGFFPTLGAMVQNPSTIIGGAVESAPSMIVGGAASRGLLKALPYVAPNVAAKIATANAAPFVASQGAKSLATLAPIAAGAAGEGIVAAGQNAEQVRQEDPNGTLTAGQSAILGASGLLTGGISMASGKLANKMGIGDVQTMLATGKLGTVGADAAETAAKKGLTRKIAEGFANEGVLQELPQSYQEQVAQNLAQGKPWDEGASKAGAQGMLAGAAMGGGANVVSHVGERAPETAPVPEPTPEPAPPALQIGNTPDPLLSFPDGTVARRSEIDAYINGLPADQQPAARAKMMGLAPQPGTQEPVVKPSEAMGLDPAAGPISAAAVTAVDTGAHQEIQLQQASEADQAAYEQATAEPEQKVSAPKPTPAAHEYSPYADANGDIVSMDQQPFRTFREALIQRQFENKAAGRNDFEAIKTGENQFVVRRVRYPEKQSNGPSTEVQSGDTGSTGVRSTDSPASVGVGATDGNGVGAQPRRSPDAVLDQAGQLPKRVDAAPVATTRAQPTTLGTQTTATAGPGFTAKDVTRVQNAPPRADTAPAAPAVEAPAVVESNAAAAEGVPGAGPASVEGDGIDADQADAPSIEDINSGKAFVDNTKSKIAEWVSKATNNGAREIDRNWERAAVKRFVDANIKAMLDGKQTGNRAAAKIAIGKSQTFSELSTAIEKFTNNTPTVTPGALSGVTSQASQPQEQPNGTQAAQAQSQQTKPEAGPVPATAQPAASDGVAAATEAGKPAEPVAPKSLREAIERKRAEKSNDSGDAAGPRIMALRAKARPVKDSSDVRLSSNPNLYVSFDNAVEAARDAVAAGVRPVPFQIHDAIDIGIGETDRVIAALSAPVKKVVTPQVEPPAEQPKEAVAPEEASDSRPGEPTAEQIESVGDVVRITKSAGKEIKRTVNARDAMKTLNERAEALQILAKACK